MHISLIMIVRWLFGLLVASFGGYLTMDFGFTQLPKSISSTVGSISGLTVFVLVLGAVFFPELKKGIAGMKHSADDKKSIDGTLGNVLILLVVPTTTWIGMNLLYDFTSIAKFGKLGELEGIVKASAAGWVFLLAAFLIYCFSDGKQYDDGDEQ